MKHAMLPDAADGSLGDSPTPEEHMARADAKKPDDVF
jgi:hypothetical protein